MSANIDSIRPRDCRDNVNRIQGMRSGRNATSL
jgi:hypothetical protein